MTESLLIREVVDIKSIDPVIDLRWVRKKDKIKRLCKGYVITEELANLFCDVLGSITGKPSSRVLEGRPPFMLRSNLITAAFGKGKSYFLLFLHEILKSLKNESDRLNLEKRFASFPYIVDQIKSLSEKKFLLILLPLHQWTELDLTTNLVRELETALKLEVDEKITFHTIYGRARETLEKIQIEKERIAIAWEEELSNYNTNLDSLIQNLANNKHSALDTFNKVFKEIMGLGANLYQEMHLEDILPDLERIVKRASFDGIVILVDELTAFLKVSGDYGRLNSDMIKIQTLAEQVNNSEIINIIIAQHETLDVFRDVFGSETDLAKVRDRFNLLPYILGSDFSEIAKSIFTKGRKFEEFKNNLKIMDLLLTLNKDMKSTFSNVDQIDLYPFHSSVIKVLPNLKALMQQERTSVKYLDNTYQRMKDQPVLLGNHLNLAKLDTIYDFFIQTESSNVLSEATEKIVEQLIALEYPKNQELKNQIVKSIIVIEESRGAFPYPVPFSVLSHCLMEDEVIIKEVIDFLKRASDQVFVDSHTGGVGIEKQEVPRDKIEEKMKELRTHIDPFSVLVNNLVELPKEYDTTFKVPRKAKIEWKVLENPEEIKKLSIFQPKGFDAVFTYIIPKTRLNYNPDLYNEEAKKSSKGKSIIVIPQYIDFLDIDILQRFEALNQLRNDPDYLEYRQIIETWWNQAFDDAATLAQNFTEPETFKFFSEYFDTPESPETSSIEIKRIFREYLQNRFPLFPWNMADIRHRRTSNLVIDDFIEPGFSLYDETMNNELKKHIDYTMSEMKFIELKDNKALFVDPSLFGSEIPAIWKVICDWAEDQDLPKPFLTLYDTLEDPPFGLSHPIIEIFVSSALKLGKFRAYPRSAKYERAKRSALVKEISNLKDRGYEKKNLWNPDVKERTLINQLGNLLISTEVVSSTFGPDEQITAWKEFTRELSHSTRYWKSAFDTLIRTLDKSIDENNLKMLEEIKESLQSLDSLQKIKDPVDGFLSLIALCGSNISEEDQVKNYWKLADQLKAIQGMVESQDFINEVISRIKSSNIKSYLESIIKNCNDPTIKLNLTNNHSEILKNIQRPMEWIISDTKRDEIRFEIEELLRRANIVYADFHNGLNDKIISALKDIESSPELALINIIEGFPIKGVVPPKNIIKNYNEKVQQVCKHKIDPQLTGRIAINIFTCAECSEPFERLIVGGDIKIKSIKELKAQSYGVLTQYFKKIQKNSKSLIKSGSLPNNDYNRLLQAISNVLEERKNLEKSTEILMDLLPAVLPDLLKILQEPLGLGPDVKPIFISDFLRNFEVFLRNSGKDTIDSKELLNFFEKFMKSNQSFNQFKLTAQK